MCNESGVSSGSYASYVCTECREGVFDDMCMQGRCVTWIEWGSILFLLRVYAMSTGVNCSYTEQSECPVWIPL